MEATVVEDDFVEIVPEAEMAAKRAAVSIVSTRMGKQKTVRLSLTFHIDQMDAEAQAILAGPRFNIAFSRRLFCLRIISADGFGKFQAVTAPRGKALILRLPLPEGLTFVGERIATRWDVTSNPRALVIDLPSDYAREAPRPPLQQPARPAAGVEIAPAPRASVNVTSSLMGDPAPGRSALDRRGKP